MKRTLQRIQPILVIGVSVLVMLICVALIAGTWVTERAAASAAVQMLQVVDDVAQTMRNGVTRMDTGLVTLDESVSNVKNASAQLSQNVNDKGLVLTLLPTTKEQELTASMQSVRDDFAAIGDFLKTTNEMVQAFNNLPFVNLPNNALAMVETFQERITKMASLVEDLKTEISEFRSQAAASVSKITQATANIGSLLSGLRADLAQVDAELNTIQMQSRQLQQLLPILLLSSAIAVTLVMIWIGYSQLVMINRALSHLRDLGSSQAAIEPVEESEETLQPEITPTTEEKTGVEGSTQTEADESPPDNSEQSMNDQS